MSLTLFGIAGCTMIGQSRPIWVGSITVKPLQTIYCSLPAARANLSLHLPWVPPCDYPPAGHWAAQSKPLTIGLSCFQPAATQGREEKQYLDWRKLTEVSGRKYRPFQKLCHTAGEPEPSGCCMTTCSLLQEGTMSQRWGDSGPAVAQANHSSVIEGPSHPA